MIRRNRRFRTGKEFDRANDFTAFLVHSGFEPHGTHGLGNGEQQTVFPGLAAEQQHRRGGRQVGIQRRTPVGRNFSDESPVRLPEEVHVHERHAPFDSQPGRRLRLRTLQVKPDQFQPGFDSLPGGRQRPSSPVSSISPIKHAIFIQSSNPVMQNERRPAHLHPAAASEKPDKFRPSHSPALPYRRRR